tara:strand:+ start:7917 stop:8969 length:1053 start_codon:yes stop_codon:yes gene_type:complete
MKLKYQEKKNAIFYQSEIIKIFSLVGMSITAFMALVAFFNENFTLGIILSFASFIYVSSYYFITLKNNLDLSSSIVLYSLYILMFYLTYHGGVENTGPLWIFIAAPVSVFIHGFKRGLIDLLAFMIVIIVILYLPQNVIEHAQYTAEFKIRLILSFSTVTFLSALYEISRQQSYAQILELSKKYELLARFDPLTKLSNRRDALNMLQYEQKKMLRNKNPVGLIICDIDYFKKINDKYGHNFGDKTLTALSELFKSQIREQDCVARWGGEEFLFILPETSIANAYIIGQKIQQALQQHKLMYKNKRVHITVSMGISQLDINSSIDEAINNADKYLYQAKHAGRNKIFPELN